MFCGHPVDTTIHTDSECLRHVFPKFTTKHLVQHFYDQLGNKARVNKFKIPTVFTANICTGDTLCSLRRSVLRTKHVMLVSCLQSAHSCVL